MGLASWITAAVVAFALARIVPLGRSRRWWPELVAALLLALILGGTATALDFGGWNEWSWGAASLAFLGAFGGTGLLRAIAPSSS